jgi:hypothetical protein
MAKSISGRIESLSYFGSVIRFDAVSTGVNPNQHKPSGNNTKSTKSSTRRKDKKRRYERTREEI